MAQEPLRTPFILACYQVYLTDGDSARFVRDIALRYSVPTLKRLTGSHFAPTRRAAALALGILADRNAVHYLGPLLSDADRAVRLIADDAIKAIWSRAASPVGRGLLDNIVAKLAEEDYSAALRAAERLVKIHPSLPEAFCQRALALYADGEVEAAIIDCERAIELNPFEYMAYVGLGQCHLELEQPRVALEHFRQAITIYPDLEPVHLQIRKLEESLRETI